MAYEMTVNLARYFHAYEMTERDLLATAEEALRLTAKDWLEYVLMQHFDSRAHGWYGVAFRSKKWNEQKRRGRIQTGGFERNQQRKLGITVTTWTDITPQPTPIPFLATGQLKAQTYGRRNELLADAKVDKSGGAAGLVLTIKMPFPHPVNQRDAGKLTVMDDRDQMRMRQRFHVHLREIIAAKGFVRDPDAKFRGQYPVAA